MEARQLRVPAVHEERDKQSGLIDEPGGLLVLTARLELEDVVEVQQPTLGVQVRG